MSDTTGIALAIIIPICIIGGCIAVLWYRRRQRQKQRLAESEVNYNPNFVGVTYDNHENDDGFTGVPIHKDQYEYYPVDPLDSDQMQHKEKNNPFDDIYILNNIKRHLNTANKEFGQNISWGQAAREYMIKYKQSMPYAYRNFDPNKISDDAQDPSRDIAYRVTNYDLFD